ncbi:alpha/beta hydrolase-fold protein [Paenibacillus aurantius]|uniref:Alpha/beta hydrolase-fold protein n=1 Tax=Paenibacillus aurantius TaxID=2918900 RepID=A0AA96LA46_9BACL|nr:alpha/beta hydrolase-fold protein [Paenibacillus aurantius]WNQ09353.1 alpha/beta hydrolase-fold protein [Paenibacillus aurantius]
MNQPSIYQRTIIRHQIQSTALSAERKLWVYLPPGYNELLSYPVVYCQDGLEFLNFGRIATHTNKLILEEDMEPPIIVGLEVDLKRRSAEYSPDGERYDLYRRFVTEEALPWVESQFPVRRTPEERILAGDSLGGTVSLHLALDYPELFRKVLSLSGAYRYSTLDRLEAEEDLSRLDLHMIVGLQETAVSTQWGDIDFITLNRKAKSLLEAKGATLHYKEADGKHVWGFWQNHLPDALRYFLG